MSKRFSCRNRFPHNEFKAIWQSYGHSRSVGDAQGSELPLKRAYMGIQLSEGDSQCRLSGYDNCGRVRLVWKRIGKSRHDGVV